MTHGPPLPQPIRKVARRARRIALAVREDDLNRPESTVPRWSACYAPHSSMYFDQFGRVRACCQNTGVYLGDVAGQSLREIWESADAEHMRASLESDDYSAGCDFCEWQLREGNESILFARQFDVLRPASKRPTWPKQMEFSLTNTCNLACVMCNGDWSSTIRSKREGRDPIPPAYDDRFFDELAEFLPHLEEVAFLGGEPFLGDEPLRVMEMLAELPAMPRVAITTNGTIRTRRVERILEAIRPNVVMSLDGASSTTYDSIRVGSSFESVLANLDWYIDTLGPDKVSITHCLMTTNWMEFADLLRLAEDRSISVGVNVVRFPAEFSLYQLQTSELEEVVAAFRSTNPGRLTAQRLRMWNGHIQALERRLAVIRRSDPTLGPAHGLAGAPEPDDSDLKIEERTGAFGGPAWLPFPLGASPNLHPRPDAPLDGADLVFIVDHEGVISVIDHEPNAPLPFSRQDIDGVSAAPLVGDFLESTFGDTLELIAPDEEDLDLVTVTGHTSQDRPAPSLSLMMRGTAVRDTLGNLMGARWEMRLVHEEQSAPATPNLDPRKEQES